MNVRAHPEKAIAERGARVEAKALRLCCVTQRLRDIQFALCEIREGCDCKIARIGAHDALREAL